MKNRKVIRMIGYDYRQSGLYFVTICTKNMEHYFGEIVDDTMVLSELGGFVNQHIGQIKTHYDFVYIHERVVMPNHVHFILKINGGCRDEFSFVRVKKDIKNYVRTLSCTSGSLGSIIRGFKIGVKKYANQNNIDFVWHSKFHDHIIRDEKAYNNIKYYIKHNPKNWGTDKYK